MRCPCIPCACDARPEVQQAILEARCHSDIGLFSLSFSGFDSRLPDLRPGVVTEACRSDTAAAVVRLHLGPLIAAMAEWLGTRLLSETMQVRFLLAALERTARRLTERPPSYKGRTKVRLLPSRSARRKTTRQQGIKVLAAAHSVLTRVGDGSSPSGPIETQALVVQRRGLRTRNAATWVRVPPGALEGCSLTIR